MKNLSIFAVVISFVALILSGMTLYNINTQVNPNTDRIVIIPDDKPCTYGMDVYAYRQDARRVLVRIQFKNCINDRRLVHLVRNKIHNAIFAHNPQVKDFEMRSPLYDTLIPSVDTYGITVLSVEDVD